MPSHAGSPQAKREAIDLTGDDEEIPKFNPIGLDDEDEEDAVELISESIPKKQASAPTATSIKLQAYKAWTGELIVPGIVVELSDKDFMLVHSIWKDSATKERSLQGNILRRSHSVDDMLPKQLNEVCLCLQGTGGPTYPSFGDYLVTRPMAEYVRIRECFFTNESFPLFSLRVQQLQIYRSKKDILEKAQLVCRWKQTKVLDASRNKVVSMSLVRLRESECDAGRRCSESVLLRNFLHTRGSQEGPKSSASSPSIPFTKHANTTSTQRQPVKVDICSPSEKKRTFSDRIEIDLTGDNKDDERSMIITSLAKRTKPLSIHKDDVTMAERQSITRFFAKEKTVFSLPSANGLRATPPDNDGKKKYTFGDICTGAGGTARGAHQAGLKLNFLLDHWDDAWTTLQLNFDAKILLKSVNQFCNQEWHSWERVDILHISYPCQPHSPAHTRDGKDDPDNIATGYSVGPIFERCRPRIVTFEQTSGIVTHNGGYHFRALIRQIIDQGYSLRSQICNLAEYGNAQPRKRLIIIAACPGQKLPTLPEITHGVGKQPLTTVRDALRNVHPMKTPDHMNYAYPKDGEAYDARAPLRSAITCSGGVGNLHPSGTRTFTLQELASLQGFPPEHQFFGGSTSIKKQIGNAVPAVFAKILYQHVTKSLEASDRQLAAYKPPMIKIDDDDE